MSSGRKRKSVHEETGVKVLCDCGVCPGVKKLTPRAVRQHHAAKRQKLGHGEEFKIAFRADSDDEGAADADFDLNGCDVDDDQDRGDTKLAESADSKESHILPSDQEDSDSSAASSDDDDPEEEAKRGRPKLTIDLEKLLFPGSLRRLCSA